MVDAVMEQQARVDFFPFVRAWSAPLQESDDRLLATACALAGVVKEVDAAMQWRDAAMSSLLEFCYVLSCSQSFLIVVCARCTRSSTTQHRWQGLLCTKR